MATKTNFPDGAAEMQPSAQSLEMLPIEEHARGWAWASRFLPGSAPQTAGSPGGSCRRQIFALP